MHSLEKDVLKLLHMFISEDVMHDSLSLDGYLNVTLGLQEKLNANCLPEQLCEYDGEALRVTMDRIYNSISPRIV